MPKSNKLVLCFLNENKLQNNEAYKWSKRKKIIDKSTCNVHGGWIKLTETFSTTQIVYLSSTLNVVLFVS